MAVILNDDLKRYLKQTRELFGDTLYLTQDWLSPVLNSHILCSPEFEKTLGAFQRQIETCHHCSLGETRNKFVFGVGDTNASLVLVGEAPGSEEDRLGEPFVGKAGHLLDKILVAIDRDRWHDVFICNVLKCRPPNNRDPLKAEVEQCEPYLIHQIGLIMPKLIVALGRVAGKTLLGVEKPLKSMRGNIHDYHGTPLIVTYHPAALLRNPGWKPEAWKDFQWIRDFLKRQTK